MEGRERLTLFGVVERATVLGFWAGMTISVVTSAHDEAFWDFGQSLPLKICLD